MRRSGNIFIMPQNTNGMIIAVGSTNPSKLEAARTLSRFGEFTYQGVSVPSGIADQPRSREETLAGAVNRARNALQAVPCASYGIGLEGGIEDDGNRMRLFGFCAIVDREGAVGEGMTGMLPLPGRVRELVLSGMELGDAINTLFSRSDTRLHEGTVGMLTDGHLKRAEFFGQAVLFAYLPFLHPELYRSEEK